MRYAAVDKDVVVVAGAGNRNDPLQRDCGQNPSYNSLNPDDPGLGRGAHHRLTGLVFRLRAGRGRRDPGRSAASRQHQRSVGGCGRTRLPDRGPVERQWCSGQRRARPRSGTGYGLWGTSFSAAYVSGVAAALPATLAYGELLGRLDGAPYEAAVTALWVLERVYLHAWACAASMSTSPFGEFVEHWMAPGFAGYVEDAPGELAILDGHDELVGDVLSHEVAFGTWPWCDAVDSVVVGKQRFGVRGTHAGSVRVSPRVGLFTVAGAIFAGYVAQDAFFLESFARAYALALAHSPDTPTRSRWPICSPGSGGARIARLLRRPVGHRHGGR